MILASPSHSSDLDHREAEYFFLSAFCDETADAQFMRPMPPAASKKPDAPRGMPAYLSSLWDIPLLTAEQEYHCFRKLNYLKYLASRMERLARSCLGCAEMLNHRDQLDQQIIQVRNFIVESNLRLVVSIVKKYASYGSNEFDDMIGVGNTALLRAVDLFDFRRGGRLSTYTYQAVRRAIFNAYRKECRVKSRFVPSGNEATETAALDAGQSLFAELRAGEARDQVIRLMDELDERDRKIVMDRFGINRAHDGVAFHVIAKEIGLSTTRTAQLFHRSIKKMRGRWKQMSLPGPREQRDAA